MLVSAIALLLALSAALGYGVFRVLRSDRRRWTRLALSLASALLLLGAGTITFALLGEGYADDEPVGSERRVSVHISRFGADPVDPAPRSRPSRREEAPAATPAAAGALGDVLIVAPPSVAPHEDFVLQVITTSTLGFASGIHRVRVLAPMSAELRTLDTCGEGVTDARSTACGTSDGRRFQVTWNVTPTESGQMLFTLAIPAEVMPYTGVDEWQARIPAGSGGGGPTASSQDPIPAVSLQGVSLDLHNHQIRVPITVVTTLGVGRTTYNVFAVLGTVLSALLGSGWLWRLLESWRTRRRPVEGRAIS